MIFLDVNTFEDIDPPKEGIQREKQYLYPDEFVQLVACSDVPLVHARLYAFAAYTQLRQGDILGLRWRDVDLSHDTITVQLADDNDDARPRREGLAESSSSPRFGRCSKP